MSLEIYLIREGKDTSQKNLCKSKFSALNDSLVSCGIPTYQYDPNRISDKTQFPYMRYRVSDLDYLKSLAAKLEENPKWVPDRNFVHKKISPDLKKKFIDKNRSHLICHYNYIGYYVPVSFQNACLPSGFLSTIGSSFNLRDELKNIANKLNLNLVTYTPNRELLFEQIYQVVIEGDLLEFEKILLLELYNMALGSIKYNLIINFCG